MPIILPWNITVELGKVDSAKLDTILANQEKIMTALSDMQAALAQLSTDLLGLCG